MAEETSTCSRPASSQQAVDRHRNCVRAPFGRRSPHQQGPYSTPIHTCHSTPIARRTLTSGRPLLGGQVNLLRARSLHNQHVSASRRRSRLLRNAGIALNILRLNDCHSCLSDRLSSMGVRSDRTRWSASLARSSGAPMSAPLRRLGASGLAAAGGRVPQRILQRTGSVASTVMASPLRRCRPIAPAWQASNARPRRTWYTGQLGGMLDAVIHNHSHTGTEALRAAASSSLKMGRPTSKVCSPAFVMSCSTSIISAGVAPCDRALAI